MNTIKDVAKLAQVSVATVSRVINNSGYVSKKTRMKVLEAIEELDYKPNEIARSLFQKTSKIIGLVIPDITNPFFPLLAKGVDDYAMKKGYKVILGSVGNDAGREENYLDFFSQHNVSGILSASDNKVVYTNEAIPLVLLDRGETGSDYSVSADNFKGGELAAEAVVNQAEKVLIMVGPRHIKLALDRLNGAVSVLEEHSIPYELFEARTYLACESESTAKELLKVLDGFDTIIASNDVYALAVIKELLKMGKNIPEDFQIIGYDNILFSQYSYPALTTVAQPAYDIGFKGAEMLFNLIEKKEINEKKVLLEPHIENRETLRRKCNLVENYSDREHQHRFRG